MLTQDAEVLQQKKNNGDFSRGFRTKKFSQKKKRVRQAPYGGVGGISDLFRYLERCVSPEAPICLPPIYLPPICLPPIYLPPTPSGCLQGGKNDFGQPPQIFDL